MMSSACVDAAAAFLLMAGLAFFAAEEDLEAVDFG
jgi:hypothetical protein